MYDTIVEKLERLVKGKKLYSFFSCYFGFPGSVHKLLESNQLQICSAMIHTILIKEMHNKKQRKLKLHLLFDCFLSKLCYQ